MPRSICGNTVFGLLLLIIGVIDAEQQRMQSSVGYVMRQLSQISDFLEAGEFSQNVIDNWKQFFEAFEDELEMQPQRYSAVKDAGSFE